MSHARTLASVARAWRESWNARLSKYETVSRLYRFILYEQRSQVPIHTRTSSQTRVHRWEAKSNVPQRLCNCLDIHFIQMRPQRAREPERERHTRYSVDMEKVVRQVPQDLRIFTCTLFYILPDVFTYNHWTVTILFIDVLVPFFIIPHRIAANLSWNCEPKLFACNSENCQRTLMQPSVLSHFFLLQPFVQSRVIQLPL